MEIQIKFDEWKATFHRTDCTDYFLKGRRLSKGCQYTWEMIDQSGRVIASFKKQWKIFGLSQKFDLLFYDNNFPVAAQLLLHFTGYPPSYQLGFNEELYQLVQHKGLSQSIFKDENQIGLFTEKSFHISSQCSARLQLDDDTNLQLVCALVYCSILNTVGEEDTFTLNLGYIGKELKPLNHFWCPNK